jgi:hypothetical protein
MDLIRQALLEKIARDAGFDRQARRHGDWLVIGSSHFGEEPLLKPSMELGRTDVALAYRARPHAASSVSGITKAVPQESFEFQGEVREIWTSASDAALGALLAIVASAARQRRGQPLQRFLAKTVALPKTTEAERVVVARVGQDVFREALIEYWNGACAVVGLNIVSLLRASHSKPWAKCETDAERLDVYNGLLLAPNLDAAFDGGWIAFDDDGRIEFSPQLTSNAADLMALRPDLKLRRIEDGHRKYLAFHREYVLRK